MALAFEQAGMACTQHGKGVLPFEQQPKESDKAFVAFSLYLSQGPERSLRKRRSGWEKVNLPCRLVQKAPLAGPATRPR